MNGINEILDGFDSSSLVAFKALADATYISEVPPIDNDYLEPVNIPAYTGASDQCLIGTDGAWNNTTLNDATWKHFYVPAGSYTSLVTLTADGTSGDRRSISLYNNNEHPGKLTAGEQANVYIQLNNASYWDLDGLSYLAIHEGNSSTFEIEAFECINGSSFNTFSRFNIDQYNRAIFFYNGCHNNTVQQCRIANQWEYTRTRDQVSIALATSGVNNVNIHNTKIIANEIHNVLDAVQLIWSEGVTGTNYEGTIIDSNKMWLDSTIYKSWNGSGWVDDPNGMFAYSENAIDIKAGSTNASNPVVMTNNVMWGWRRQAGTAEFNGDPGPAITGHYNTPNIVIDNNIFFDNMAALNWSAQGSPQFSFRNNIIYECDKVHPEDARHCLYMYYINNLSFERNTFVSNNDLECINLNNNTPLTSFVGNLCISNTNVGGSTPTAISDNYFYETPTSYAGTDGGVASNANMIDLTITYDNFTTSPKSHTLTGVVSTPSSPHYGVAGSDLT